MSLTLVTAPTSEPVTLSELKNHLRLDGSDDDGYVSKCITAARQWIEGQTKRAIISQTWDYNIDGGWPTVHGLYRIDLPLNPVQAASASSPEVFSVSYIDSSGASQTLAASQYTLVNRTHGSYIVPAYDVTWPTTRCVPNAVTVRFVAGAATADEDMKLAVKMLAGHYYEMRETAEKAPLAVEALISPYRGASLP